MGYAKRSLIVLPLIFLIRFFILFFAISHIKPSRLLYPISQGVRGQKKEENIWKDNNDLEDWQKAWNRNCFLIFQIQLFCHCIWVLPVIQ